MKLPYLILAILLIAIAVVFVFSKLPKIGDEGETASSEDVYKRQALDTVGIDTPNAWARSLSEVCFRFSI